MATLRERILDYLRLHPIAADDDQLAIALGVRRQAINIACRGLVNDGAILRYHDSHHHKLVNRLPESGESVSRVMAPSPQTVVVPTTSRACPFRILDSSNDVRGFAYPGETLLSEDSVKAAVKEALERDGWTTRVQYGHFHGIDIEASRGGERLILEVKGEGSLNPMRVNYFLGALGELLQRMESPAARYGLALPAHRQFIGLINRLPDWVRQRLGLCFYLVRPTREGLEIGVISPRSPQVAGGVN